MQWPLISSGNVIVFVSSIVACSVHISAVVLEDDPVVLPWPPVINMLPSLSRMEDAEYLTWVICFVLDHVPASYLRQDFSFDGPDDVCPPQTINFPWIIWAMWSYLPSGRSLMAGQSALVSNGVKLSTEGIYR